MSCTLLLLKEQLLNSAFVLVLLEKTQSCYLCFLSFLIFDHCYFYDCLLFFLFGLHSCLCISSPYSCSCIYLSSHDHSFLSLPPLCHNNDLLTHCLIVFDLKMSGQNYIYLLSQTYNTFFVYYTENQI